MAGPDLELTEEVVVASAGARRGDSARRHRSRAGLQRLPDGRLLAAYRVGWDMFGRPHGAVVCTWSEDGGMHWETPQPVVAEPGWDWFGAQRLVQFDDGGLLLLAGRARWEAGDFETIPLRSDDGGRTWERDDGAIEVFPLESEPYGRGAGERSAEGQLLMGFHGRERADGSVVAGIAVSKDQGRSWNDCILIGARRGLDFREPDLLRLDDGRLLAVMRTDTPPFASMQSYSADGGRSWSEPEPTGFSGHCPRLVQLPDGLACFYRDMDVESPGIAFHLASGGDGCWRYGGHLYRSTGPYEGWGSACGYPDVVALGGGRYFCLYHSDFGDGESEIRGAVLSLI